MFMMCRFCSRRMFLTATKVLPHHRQPQPAAGATKFGRYESRPLTGKDQPWCEGSGKP